MKRGILGFLILFSLILIITTFFSIPLICQEKTDVWTPQEVIPGPNEHPQELIKLTQEFRAIESYGRGIPDFAAVVQRQKELLPK